MKKYFVGVIASIATLVAFLLGGQFNLGASSQLPAENYWLTETATSGVTVVSTDQRIAATNTARKWLRITPHASCTNGLYVSFANDKAAVIATNAFFVGASTSLEIMPNKNPYIGSIHAIANSGSCSVNVTGE